MSPPSPRDGVVLARCLFFRDHSVVAVHLVGCSVRCEGVPPLGPPPSLASLDFHYSPDDGRSSFPHPGVTLCGIALSRTS